MLRKRPHDRRARRCRELFLRTERVRRPLLQEFCDRWRRYGHGAMRAAHITAADIEPRRKHLLDAEIVEADGRTDDVDDGVHRADLVERYLCRRLAMNLSLRLSEQAENSARFFLHGFGERRFGEQRLDIRQRAMNMRMGLRFLRLSMRCLRHQPHVDVSGTDALLRDRRAGELELPRERQLREFLPQMPLRHSRL